MISKTPFLSLSLAISIVATPALLPAAPAWIWTAKSAKSNEQAVFRASFNLTAVPEKVELRMSCDNEASVVVNGKPAGGSAEWKEPSQARIEKLLVAGDNWISVRAKNDGGNMAGLVLEVADTSAKKPKELFATNGQWKWSADTANWDKAATDLAGWKAATVLGDYGMAPWGAVFEGVAAGGGSGPASGTITVPDGFKADLIYRVPKSEQGSWVSLAVDNKGRLLAGDQGGKVYRITLPQEGGEAAVEALPIKAGHAQGLLYANNALYVVTNGPGAGLYKCTDADGDGVFEDEKLLRKMQGGGEHGPHQVVLAPDGKSIYVLGGNHTKLPEPEKSLVPRVWQEDHLLPRMWDANGHAKGILAPGGWICRTDFDGREWTLVSMGYRNQYDLAFNLEGEGFTFDADMEWDIGSPWYRPTRICHAVPSSEFGWRSGSGKWPSYYLDSLPATVDIGPGSPVGCVFGTGAKFPEKYQRALFALDWTYGTMYAVHLQQDGSSYSGTKEPFVTGRPLPLTDAIIHPDGAMYFTIGGRGSQSAVYRVTYTGSESTAPVAPKPLKKEAKWRHELVALLDAAPSAEVVEKAWKFIGNKDRFLRFTARSVIENQPVNLWQEKALAESEAVNSSLDALCALCRVGDKSLQPKILAALRKVHDQGLRETEALELLRVYSLCFTRMGKPTDPAVLKALCEQFEPMFPSPTNAALANQLNKEVCELLVYLGSKQIVPKAMLTILTATDDSHQDAPGADVLQLNEGYARAIRDMQKTRPNRQQIAFAYALQHATEGWTPDLRRTFFRWFNTALKWRGGNSFTGFLKNMRAEALKHAPEEMRGELGQLAEEMLSAKKELPRAEGPGKPYSIEEVLAMATQERLTNRDFARGKKMFEAGLCGTCHRMAGEYGGVGPDITGAGNRYSMQDLLENIINPSKIISDQYESTLVEKLDGGSVVGRILQEDDNVVKLAENALMPDQVTEVKVAEIKARSKYPVSAMPPALLNNMNEEEVLDLLAFILSAGNPEDKSFKKP